MTYPNEEFIKCERRFKVFAGGRRSGKTHALIECMKAERGLFSKQYFMSFSQACMQETLRQYDIGDAIVLPADRLVRGISGSDAAFYLDNAGMMEQMVLGPDICSHSTVRIASTPHGLNHFWKTWKAAALSRSAFQERSPVNLDELVRKGMSPDLYRQEILAEFVGPRPMDLKVYPDEPGVWIQFDSDKIRCRHISLKELSLVYVERGPWVGPIDTSSDDLFAHKYAEKAPTVSLEDFARLVGALRKLKS